MRLKCRKKRESGAILVLVAATLPILLIIGAFTIDIGYIFVIRNQLQNAADAGALAAGRRLYNNDGQSVNANANSVGRDAAIANTSQNLPVEVIDATSNSGDVQRGHWSFGSQTFTPNASLLPVNLADVSTAELDANIDFINAVRVRVRREATPAVSFLGRLAGHDQYQLTAEGVAYIGFAGQLGPGEADQPIAICKQAIELNDEFTCTNGRMINSGGNDAHNTGGWTDFEQSPCSGAASANDVRSHICGTAPGILLGAPMSTVGGMQNVAYDNLRDCWWNGGLDGNLDGRPDQAWNLTLPVIDCPSNNVGPCSDVVGAVSVDVVWVKQSGADPQYRDIPLYMDGWSCSLAAPSGTPTLPNDLTEAQRITCWDEFVVNFNLLTYDGSSASILTHSELQKTIFFKPSCTPHVPRGRTGGENFGILAKIPVLVD